MSVPAEVHRRLCAESSDDARPMADRIGELVDRVAPLSGAAERAAIIAAVWARVRGLGALQPLADDPSVAEIIVNAGSHVWIERNGELEPVDLDVDAAMVEGLVRRLVSAVGRRIDRSHPVVDARLADGSRLHAMLPPLAVDGPCLNIRRFVAQGRTLDDFGPGPAVELLTRAVRARANLVVSGGTSSGKTSLLNALASEIAPSERIITIEDAAELDLRLPHVVRLETRGGGEGGPEVAVSDLVRSALRMRPDRIVCGEMRGAEAFDLVQALNTGHAGSMTTVHANGPNDALRRVETMMLGAAADLPLAAVRSQLCACVDLVVMVRRERDGARRIVAIAETPAQPSGDWNLRVLWTPGSTLDRPERGWAA